MSGRGGGGGGRRSNSNNNEKSVGTIPAASRKMVESLKEIVNFPDSEIYSVLLDCNMDPNDAVNRLLSEDAFREVKSKREKKKENKDTDPRSRGASSNLAPRGGRGGADRYGRSGSTYFSSNESSFLHGKSAYKKENGAHAYSGSSSAASGMPGNNINRQPIVHSDPVPVEYQILPVDAGDGVLSSSQHASGFQSVWLGVPGQVSMADIVKMGRPHDKASAMPPIPNVNRVSVPPPAASLHDAHSSEYHPSKVLETNAEPNIDAYHHVHSNGDWPSIEQLPPASVSSVLEARPNSELDLSNLPLDRLSQSMKSQTDEVKLAEDGHVETLHENHSETASIFSRNMQKDSSGVSSLFDNNLYGNMNSYQPHGHTFEHNEDEEDGASSVDINLQQLNLQNNDQGTTLEDDNPSLIIPDHLQVHAQDCSHLSFGSFGTGISSAFSGPSVSRPLKINLDEASEVVDASSAVHSNARNPEYYGEELLRSAPEENLVPGAGVSSGNYDSSSVPQPEVLKEETPEAAQGNQYTFPSSAPGHAYENIQQLNATFNNAQLSAIQNIAPFSSVMAYSKSLQSNLLASTVQPGREPDLPYSPFSVTQSIPIRYNDTASSISGPSISMPEVLRAGTVSTPQQNPQTLPGASVASGPTLPQHLAVHPYSHPTLPLGHFANMVGYPLLPQSYTYMPSAFQQTFGGNSTYQQSLAAMLPQYKNSVPVSSLPPSAAVGSGYGFGNSANIPTRNFPLSPPAAPIGTTLGYDDVLSTQYKDAHRLISLQQNENSAMWIHGPGSQSTPAVPASTYYDFQPGGFRQGQQPPSQHVGAFGYPNHYHSQSGISLEHQQQNSMDGSLGGSQGQPSKQTQQLWQNGY